MKKLQITWNHYKTCKFIYIKKMLYAINNIPKPNFLVYVVLKSELSGPYQHVCHNPIDTLNMFNTRLKKHNREKVNNVESNYYYIGKDRHYPPAINEWFNSICVYNKTLKLLPTLDKVTLKLVKSYFNFYYDLLQTLLSRVYNSLEWGLNSPPKPHAFVSLLVQSSFFSIPSRFINIIKYKFNETFLYTVFLVFFFCFAYRLPTKFMLSQLDLLLYLPLFSIIYSLCCAFSICQVSKKELTISRLVFIVFSGLSIPLMIYFFRGNFNELHVCICSALALVSGMAIPSEGPVVIDMWKRLTLYKNGDSNASTPPAGQNSGSSNRPSRSNIMSISSILAGSAPATGSSHGPVSGSAAGTSGSSDSNDGSAVAGTSGSSSAAAGTSAQPRRVGVYAGTGVIYAGDEMTNSDLDRTFGPPLSKQEVGGIYNKIMDQIREIHESNRNNPRKSIQRSIFENYSFGATLSPNERRGLARMLLGGRPGYLAVVKGSSSNPNIKIMIEAGGGRKSIVQSSDLIEFLKKNK